MSETRSGACFPASAESRRMHPMIVALAQIGWAGVFVAQPVHAAPWQGGPLTVAERTEPVLYLAQANSDYSKMPGKRPADTTGTSSPALPSGTSVIGPGGTSSTGGKPASGSEGNTGSQRR